VIEQIHSVDDPRLRDYRGLSDPELLRSRNLFMAEGRLVVTRLLQDRRWTIRSVLLNRAACRQLEPAMKEVETTASILLCAPEHFLAITGHDIHRGCLALVERPRAVALEVALAGARLVIVLEGVSNPDNVGGVFRNAAAFGGDLVVLSPSCCDPLYRKAVRTSMGAALRVPFVQVAEWPEPLMQLRAAGFTLSALTLRQPSEPLSVFAARPRPEKTALLVGAEGSGLTAAAEAAADNRVRIPITASVDSLNLAVATGIALERMTSL
jgi:tRNA G18 (ribose-2'-O)-methylase SpoU